VTAAWRRHWRLFVLLGFLQMWPQTIVLIALNYTTAINATLINGAQPAMAAILLAVFYRDRITLGQSIGIALALGGIVVMVSRGDWHAVAALEFNIGDWLTLFAILCFAFYSIQVPRLPRATGLATALFLITLTGTTTMFPVFIYEQMFIRSVTFDGVTIVTVLWMGIVISTASILLWNMCLSAIGTQKAAIFLNLNPIFAALFAIVFLGEQLFAYHFVGAVLVLGGITMVIRLARRAASADAIAPKVEA
jgi:drug/metabolite transporter (DMT)-like permease